MKLITIQYLLRHDKLGCDNLLQGGYRACVKSSNNKNCKVLSDFKLGRGKELTISLPMVLPP